MGDCAARTDQEQQSQGALSQLTAREGAACNSFAGSLGWTASVTEAVSELGRQAGSLAWTASLRDTVSELGWQACTTLELPASFDTQGQVMPSGDGDPEALPESSEECMPRPRADCHCAISGQAVLNTSQTPASHIEANSSAQPADCSTPEQRSFAGICDSDSNSDLTSVRSIPQNFVQLASNALECPVETEQAEPTVSKGLSEKLAMARKFADDRIADSAASAEVVEHLQLREAEFLKLIPSESQRRPETVRLLKWLLKQNSQCALTFTLFQLLDAAYAVLGSDESELSLALACWCVVGKMDHSRSPLSGRVSLPLAIVSFNRAGLTVGLLPTNATAVKAMEAKLLDLPVALLAPTAEDWLGIYLQRFAIVTAGRLPSELGAMRISAVSMLAVLTVLRPITTETPPQQCAAVVAGLIAVRLGLAAPDIFDAEATDSVNVLLSLLPESETHTACYSCFASIIGIERPASRIVRMLAEAVAAG